MASAQEPRRQTSALRQITALAGAGIQFAVTTAVIAAAGWWADERLGSSPWLFMSGAMVGAVTAFFQLYRTLINASAKDEADEPDGED